MQRGVGRVRPWEWALWGWWTIASVAGTAVIWLLGQSAGLGPLGFWCGGAVAGFGHWLVLRRRVPMPWWGAFSWMSGGFLVALVPYAVAILFMDAPADTCRGAITIGFVVIGGVVGQVAGAVQAETLLLTWDRRAWLVVSGVAGAGGWALSVFLGVYGCLAVWVLSGAALVALLRWPPRWSRPTTAL